MGRRAAPVTKADIMRAIRAVQNAGLPVVRVRVRPDGEIIIETVDTTPSVVQMDEPQDADRIIFL